MLKSKVSFLFCLLILFQACSIKRLIPENKILLQKISIDKAPRDYKKELYSIIIQRPRNKGFISSQPYLWFYMRFDKGKDSGFFYTVRNIFGEKPMYLDTNLTKESVKRLNDYNFNKGYFNAVVTLDPHYKNRNQLKLSYVIDLKEPHYISEIKYVITDSNIKSVIEHAASKPIIATGQIYDSEALMNESIRLTSILNNEGYYKFNKNYIYYEVDTATFSKQNNVSITLFVQNLSDTSFHKKYLIRSISLEPDFRLTEATSRDTLKLKEFNYITQTNILKPNTFYRHVRFASGELFSLDNIKQTITQLSDIQYFKYIDISFAEFEKSKSDTGILDCNIKLTPMTRRAASIDLEVNTTAENKIIWGTSSRYYGMAGSFNIRNRNLFRQAIQLSMGIMGGFDIQAQQVDGKTLFGNYQLGLNSALYFPTAYIPKAIFNSRNYKSSKTAIDLVYFYEYTTEYSRTTSSLALIYQLNKKYIRHFITPIELNLVKTVKEAAFEDTLAKINDPLLSNIFDTHLLTILKYATFFNNKEMKRNQFWSTYFNIETAGNLCWLFNRYTSDIPYTESTTYTLAGFKFYQYMKGDLEISYHFNLNDHNSVATRLVMGIGVPYGNSDLLPFEKKYYIGGANSIRAWAMREIGPGTYKDASNVHYEQSGEMKLEGNVEYRFNIYSIMKGALFVDAGNIWNINNDTMRSGDAFMFNSFLSEIAIGTGVGLRFDFTFFIFRLDLGIPLRDPTYGVTDRDKWVGADIYKDGWMINNSHLNIAIGYPF